MFVRVADDLQQTLDALDSGRFDVDAILASLAAYAELSDEAQSDALGPWEYSGLSEAEHPLSELLPELHNDAAVVRDLTGELHLLHTAGVSGRWQTGPLFREHFPNDADLTDSLENAGEELAAIPPVLVLRTIRVLPTADGPARTY